MRRAALVFLLLILSLLNPTPYTLSPAFSQSDTTPPLTTATLSGTQGLNDWYVSGVDVHLVADDLESGVHSIYWKLDQPEADGSASGGWQQEDFLGTLNRIQNPSFESGGPFWIDKWGHTDTPLGQSIFLRSLYHKFGSRSARIIFLNFFEPQYYYWHNEDYYSVTEAGKVYTVNAWSKTKNLDGEGAYAAVWGKNLSGDDALITETAKVAGTSDWSRISFTFTMPDGFDGVYLRLGAHARWGSVWWDGVSLYEEEETGVSFAVGTSGEHTLEYYAVDNAGNEELPHRTLDFKIDTSAPGGWRNFEATKTLNDHTFVCSVDVSDSISGIDVSTAAYQYTYDGGQAWSDWLTNVTVVPAVDGSTTVRITTPDIDFHDSHWEIGKVIRFKISDLAGLGGVSPDQHLFGAWMKSTGGDVYAGGDIAMGASGSEDNAEGVIVVSGSEISNFYSTHGWEISSYPQILRLSYAKWLEEFPTTAPLPYGRLPLADGRYFAGAGDFLVDNQTVPAGPGGDLATTENLAAVIFVGGNLIINVDFEVHPTSVLLFIVGGDVRVAKNVEKIGASFLADSVFDTSYDGSPPQKQLAVEGLAAADQFIFRRSLSGDDNLTEPAEVFAYPAKIIQLAPYLGEGAVRWRER